METYSTRGLTEELLFFFFFSCFTYSLTDFLFTHIFYTRKITVAADFLYSAWTVGVDVIFSLYRL